MEVGDDVILAKDEEVIAGMIPLDNERRLMRVLIRSLENFGDQKARMELLSDVLNDPFSVLAACELTRYLAREHGICGDKLDLHGRAPVLQEDDVKRTLRKITRRIKDAGEGDLESPLAKHPQVLNVVFNWMTFGSETAAGRWIRRQATNDEFLIAILNQASSKIRSHGMSDRVVRETLTVNTAFLDRFFNLKQLKSRCESILSDSANSLTEKQTLLLTITAASISDDGEPLNERGHRRRERVTDSDQNDAEPEPASVEE